MVHTGRTQIEFRPGNKGQQRSSLDAMSSDHARAVTRTSEQQPASSGARRNRLDKQVRAWLDRMQGNDRGLVALVEELLMELNRECARWRTELRACERELRASQRRVLELEEERG